MPLSVGLVTCACLPEADADREPLRDALIRRGMRANWVAWDDPYVVWVEHDLLVLRSTWNYYLHPDAFLAWLRRVSAQVRLLNPPDVVEWNAHKGYLAELAGRGLPVTPTEHLRRGSAVSLAELCARRGWSDVVIKPAVSAGSWTTRRARADALGDAQAFLDRVLAERDMLVQPYLTSVEGHGERSLVFIDGTLTHAIRKTPRFAQDREDASAAQPIADDERAVAERIVASVGQRLLYARVDLARDATGHPLLMELELIEPSLFLRAHPPALELLADAIAASVESS